MFDGGDMPLPGVRLFLNSGQSVVTDSQGLYNFPSLGDGAQVISLDPMTLAKRYALTDNGSLAGRSWTRLLRTPLGGGALLRQNFALAPVDQTDYVAAANHASPTRASAETISPASSEVSPSRISWPKQAGVSRYRLQLSSDESFNDIIFDDSVSGNEYGATELAPGRYFWRVAAAQDKTGQFTMAAAFEVKSSTTQELVTSETLEPVALGEVTVLSPAANTVVMSPALQLEARVALNWKVRLEINGTAVSEKNVGTIRQDHKNNVTTFTYVGVELRPGPNTLRVSAISPQGTVGHSRDLVVQGRGPARRLEITAEKNEIQTGGHDSTLIRVRAFDEWGNPAADDQVAVETSTGKLVRISQKDGVKAGDDRNAEVSSASSSQSAKPSFLSSRSPKNNEDLKNDLVIVSLVGRVRHVYGRRWLKSKPKRRCALLRNQDRLSWLAWRK
jgi:hypothetical protein